MADLKSSLLTLHAVTAKADKKVNALAEVVKKKIGTVTSSFGADPYLRASGLYNACPREYVFRTILPTPAPVTSSGHVSDVMRMETGTFLHWYFQNIVLGPAKILVGMWQRWVDTGASLKRETVYGYRPDGPLPDYNEPTSMMLCWTFVEQMLLNDEFKLSGHIDGIVDTVAMEAFLNDKEWEPINFSDMDWKAKIAPKRLMLLEIKSTDDNVLRTIKEKGVEYLSDVYKCQATIYQRLTGFDSTLFLYVDRKYFQFVGFEYAGEDQYWDLARIRGMQIQASIKTETLPPRVEGCPFRSAKRAEDCVYCDVCFSEEPDLVWGVMKEMEKHLPEGAKKDE